MKNVRKHVLVVYAFLRPIKPLSVVSKNVYTAKVKPLATVAIVKIEDAPLSVLDLLKKTGGQKYSEH
jgi:hypothetical protein